MRWGLALRACAPDELMATTMEHAEVLAAKPISSLRSVKRLMGVHDRAAIEAAREGEDAAFVHLMGWTGQLRGARRLRREAGPRLHEPPAGLVSATGDLTWRPLTPDDAEAWADLMAAIEQADGFGEHYTPDDLADELGTPSLDLAPRHVRAVLDGEVMVALRDHHGPDARPRAAASRSGCRGGVRPSHRGRGIGRDLLGRMEARAADIHRDRLAGAPSRLVVHALDHTHDRRHLLERTGYSIERWFFDMDRDLAEPVDDPRVPADLSLTAFDPAHDDAVRRRPQRGLRHPLGFVAALPRGVAAVVHRRPPLPARPQLRRARRRRARGLRPLPPLPRGGRAAGLHVRVARPARHPGALAGTRARHRAPAPHRRGDAGRRARPRRPQRRQPERDRRAGPLRARGLPHPHPEGRLTCGALQREYADPRPRRPGGAAPRGRRGCR